MSKVRIAHLSDPHFGTVYPQVEKALLKDIEEIAPDLVLISGDITQRARSWQFRAANLFRQQIKQPFFAVPGNHDIPLFNVFGRLLHPYYGFHHYFQAKRETQLRVKDVCVMGLNSTSRWRHIQGKLDLNRVRDQLLNSWGDAKTRVVMLHHPLSCRKPEDQGENLLRGIEQTQELFRQAKVDLVLSGHVHDPWVTTFGNSVVSTAGTCLSWRTRKDAPNSYHCIDIDSDSHRITVERRDVKDWVFQPVKGSRKIFAQEASGWTENL